MSAQGCYQRSPGSARSFGARCLGTLALVMSMAGCYTRTPMMTLPEPGVEVDIDLNDMGRVGLVDQIGPEVANLRGEVAQRSDSAVTLRVTRIVSLGGDSQKWAGDRVTVRREYMRSIYERRISRERSLLAVGASGAAIGLFIASRNLLGLGGSSSDRTPGGGGGAEQ